MEHDATEPPYHLSKFGWTWLGTLVLSSIASWVIGIFNNSTELTPRHDEPLQFALYAACLVTVFSAALIFVQSRGVLYRRLGMSLIVVPIFAFLGVFLLSSEVSALVEMHNDFPSERTRAFDGLLMLQRAYQTHGKGRSWNIQTMPIWSNIDITQSDYKFMLEHRAPGDNYNNEDEIKSNGYFCAKVTMEQSGEALRVMHAGHSALPSGSIGICSQLRTTSPRLPVVE